MVDYTKKQLETAIIRLDAKANSAETPENAARYKAETRVIAQELRRLTPAQGTVQPEAALAPQGVVPAQGAIPAQEDQGLTQDPLNLQAKTALGALDSLPSNLPEFLKGIALAPGDVLQGLGQLTGLVNNDDLNQRNLENKSITDTTAGQIGRGIGHAGQFMLGGPILNTLSKAPKLVSQANKLRFAAQQFTNPTLLGGAAAGGGYAALQPVQEGDSRLGQAGFGALAGSAAPFLVNTLKGAKALIDPMRPTGRELMLGKLLRSQTGDKADDVAQRLLNAEEIIPGSQPTTSQIAESSGLSQMNRVAQGYDAEAFGSRAIQNNLARQKAIHKVAGDQPMLDAAFDARDTAVKGFLETTKKSTAQVKMNESNKLLSEMLEENVKRPEVKRVLETVKGTFEAGVDGNQVKTMIGASKSLGDMMAKTTDGVKSNKFIMKELRQLKTSLDEAITVAEPAHGKFLKTYTELSRPINKMQVAQKLEEKLVPALSDDTGVTQRAASYANALRDGDKLARRATGFNRATLAETLGDDVNVLNAVKDDLVRVNYDNTAGRAVGSNTFQNFATNNILSESGLPPFVKDLPLIRGSGMRMINNVLYGNMDEQMKGLLVEALLNPKVAGQAMQAAEGGTAIIDSLRRTAPALIGANEARR